MPDEFSAVFARQGDRVYRMAYICCRAEADDIVQEVFLRYLRASPNFPDEARERAWFLKTTINLCRSRLRSPWYRCTIPLDAEIFAPGPEPESLSELVDRLPEAYRAPVHLHYYEGYSTRECAALLGLSESAVRMRLLRARNLLKTWLEEESE